MEGGDGLSVLNRIRRHAPLTISVVLTGFASVESAIAALQEGAYDYLIKPCDIESMKHTIRRGVEHRRLMLAEQKARADLRTIESGSGAENPERTAELTRLNGELADANRAKDVFLATLSHELRTPLTPVVGWIKLLRSGTLDEKSVSQALDAIERNAWLQSRLIDDLLDTSRIATGKLHFEPKADGFQFRSKGGCRYCAYFRCCSQHRVVVAVVAREFDSDGRTGSACSRSHGTWFQMRSSLPIPAARSASPPISMEPGASRR